MSNVCRECKANKFGCIHANNKKDYCDYCYFAERLVEEAYAQGIIDHDRQSWRTIPLDEYKPKSAKEFPIWIKLKKSGGVALVYMTSDEDYFVSTDHRRVYRFDEVYGWRMLDVPVD